MQRETLLTHRSPPLLAMISIATSQFQYPLKTSVFGGFEKGPLARNGLKSTVKRLEKRAKFI